ncbi:MAG: hypothetical protein JKY70_16185 [Mucilaginibacter sp.]|nr:hypothetical protein [Mucilaginibacter sp.]
MSKRLEDFISQNREEFDDLEPRADIWANIAKGLDAFDEQQAQLPKKREAKTFSLGFVLKVAASVIVVMGIGFGIYLKTLKPANNGVDLADINPTYAKQQVHLVSVIETQKNELKQIAKFDPQLYQEFNGEITRMQSIYKKLNADLATSPNQERVLRAMIRNLQIQTEVLNQQLSVIQQFNDSKNEQHEKSI